MPKKKQGVEAMTGATSPTASAASRRSPVLAARSGMPPAAPAAAASGGIHSRRGYSVPTSVTTMPTRDRGRGVGMLNQGNSCYLSAVLQALLGQRCFVTDLLHAARIMGEDTHAIETRARAKAALLTDRKRRRDAGEEFTDSEDDTDDEELDLVEATSTLSRTFYLSLVTLVMQMRETSHGIIDTARLKAMIGARYSKFAGSQQQDAHEFLSECLSHLDDDILRVLKPATQPSPTASESDGSDDMDTSEAQGNSSPSSATSNAAAHSLLRRSLSSASTLQLQVDNISPIYKNLHCEIEQTLACVKCAYTRTKSEHFNDISLDLPDVVKSARSASPAVSAAASPSPTPAPISLPESPVSLSDSSEPSSPATPPTTLPVVSPPLTRRKSCEPLAAAVIVTPPSPPTLECPKHGRTMVPSLVQGITTSHFRCIKQRCREEGVVQHSLATPTDTIALTTLQPPTQPSVNAATGRKGLGGPYLASLSELLSKFFQPHEIAYRCDRCDSDRLRKSYSFKQLPRVLILHVKRFQPNLIRGTYEKRMDRVRIDETIDLGFACTRNTRKPIPVDGEDTTMTSSDDANADLETATKLAEARDHATFASLFAATATAACKCGAGGLCAHARGVLTDPAEIAAFIAKQQPRDAASPSAAGAQVSRAKNYTKRKGVPEAATTVPESTQIRKKAKNNTASSQPTSSEADPSAADAPSYFVESDAASALSGVISRQQADLRTLQQQMIELSQSPLVAPAAASSFAPSALPARFANRRESALSAMVMRVSEMEAQITQNRDKLLALQGSKHTSRATPFNNACSPSPSPSPSSTSVLPSLGPGVVPLYELAAIIQHKGLIATSGHYITDLKSSGSTGVDGANHTGAGMAWKRYDDSYVRTLDPNQAVQYAEREGYVFMFQYQPILNILHLQQERHAQANAVKDADASLDDVAVETPSLVPAAAPTKRASPSPSAPRASPSPSAPRPAGSLPAPFGPNAGRFKRWKMVRGQRVVWWIDKLGNVVLGTPPADHEVDPKPPKQKP